MFTSLLLADAVRRRDVALTDPVSKFLPSKVKVPERGGRAITLQDLSSHVSGLPRLPANMSPKDGSNPYADYSVEDMYTFLSAYELTRDVGAQYEYSNLGGGLLGHVLSLRAGMDYEALVRSRISGPRNRYSDRRKFKTSCCWATVRLTRKLNDGPLASEPEHENSTFARPFGTIDSSFSARSIAGLFERWPKIEE